MIIKAYCWSSISKENSTSMFKAKENKNIVDETK